MTEPNKIVWEHFVQPEDPSNNFSIVKPEEDEDEDDKISEDEIVQSIMSSSEFVMPQDTIQTPFGIYQKNYAFTPYQMFDCWIGHTNFRLTNRHLSILNSVNGIGCVKVLSPYRFFIGIEKLFEFTSVRAEIQRSMY